MYSRAWGSALQNAAHHIVRIHKPAPKHVQACAVANFAAAGPERGAGRAGARYPGPNDRGSGNSLPKDHVKDTHPFEQSGQECLGVLPVPLHLCEYSRPAS